MRQSMLRSRGLSKRTLQALQSFESASAATMRTVAASPRRWKHSADESVRISQSDHQQMWTPLLIATTMFAGVGVYSCQENWSSQRQVVQCEGQVVATSPVGAEKVSLASIGVHERDVDDLVKELLADQSVNISVVPDAIEKQLYKSTILLTLNAVYSLVFSLQGTNILSHEISLSVDRKKESSKQKLSKALAQGAATEIDDAVLQQVADRLLENPAVNSAWIPDSVEREIYRACLQVIFRILQVVLSSVKIRLCGHELRLKLGSVSNQMLEQAALNVTSGDKDGGHSMLTPVDMEILRKLAKGAGVNETNNDYFWNRIFTSKDFVEHLHVSLYGLVLGILDDVFNDLQIEVLSDTIHLDLVAAKQPTLELAENTPSPAAEVSGGSGVSVESFAAASFLAGMGVGVTLMSVLTTSSK